MGRSVNKKKKSPRWKVIKKITKLRLQKTRSSVEDVDEFIVPELIDESENVHRSVAAEHNYALPGQLLSEPPDWWNSTEIKDSDDSISVCSIDSDLHSLCQQPQYNNIRVSSLDRDLCNGYVHSESDIEDCDNVSVSTFASDLNNRFTENDFDEEYIETSYYDNSECDVDASKEDDHQDEEESLNINGRRIFDIKFLFEQIRALTSHSKEKTCDFSDMVCVKEIKQGLRSTFHFECLKCRKWMCIRTADTETNSLDLNYASVLGSYAVGIGFTQTKDLLANMDIPYMSSKFYNKNEKILQSDLLICAEKVKKDAIEEEKRIAVEKGEMDVKGTPHVCVKGDASWSKRAYRKSYSSKSGTATLVGFHTGKVVWTGVKNKYCQKCASDSSRGIETEHECNTNYHGPPTGMESKLIVEAFQESEEKYGCRYYRLIADGDAKTYKALLDASIYTNPYLKIEKLDCCIHLYRSCRSRFAAIDTKIKVKSEQIIKDIQCARMHWSKQDMPFYEKVERLRRNILNIPQHVYGNHTHCEKYYCSRSKEDSITNNVREDCDTGDSSSSKEDSITNNVREDCDTGDSSSSKEDSITNNVREHCDTADSSSSKEDSITNNVCDDCVSENCGSDDECMNNNPKNIDGPISNDENIEKNEANLVPKMYQAGIMQKIYHSIGRLLDNAKSLLYNYNTNRVEQFNSNINKHIGGKRNDYTRSNNYKARVDAATIDFNTKRLGSTILQYKTGLSIDEINSSLIYKVESVKIDAESKRKRKPKHQQSKYSPDENYGTETCEQAEVDPEAYECRKSLILQELQQNQINRETILRNTIGQCNNDYWDQIRSQMVTASTFGRICRVRSVASYKGIVNDILDGRKLDSVPSIRHGQDNEFTAIKQFELEAKVKVKRCGIFIDEVHAFLGASPDGLIGDDGLVEMKCPFASRDETVEDGILKGLIKFWRTTKRPRKRKTPHKNTSKITEEPLEDNSVKLRKGRKRKSAVIDAKDEEPAAKKVKMLALEPKRKVRGRPRKSLASIENLPETLLASVPVKQVSSRVKRNAFNDGEIGDKPTKKKIKTAASKPTRKLNGTQRKSLVSIENNEGDTMSKTLPLTTKTDSPSDATDEFVPKILGINKIHYWYYQVQAQLHIANRQYCYLVVWTCKDLKYEKIERDDNFWKTEIEPKILKFFNEAFLPERVRRSITSAK